VGRRKLPADLETGAPPSYNDALEVVQTGLDVVGMAAGEVADLANAGNYAKAARSMAAMVPLAGSGATLSKAALKYGDEALAADKYSDDAVALVDEAASVVPDVSKSADEAMGASTQGFWNKTTEFQSNTVYQRDDLIVPEETFKLILHSLSRPTLSIAARLIISA
jgi:hypothetical protein